MILVTAKRVNAANDEKILLMHPDTGEVAGMLEVGLLHDGQCKRGERFQQVYEQLVQGKEVTLKIEQFEPGGAKSDA